mmetsp:Transcript_4606/g.12575  ORF Transcript_4606/g.12575 Transcript_4606/m.12575 type:complete len:361 (+) Transcript_4606:1414-2496(+)
MALLQALEVHIGAHVRVDNKLHALSCHQVHAPLHHVQLVGLHVGHTIHHEAADAVCALKHSDFMAHLVELVGGSEACRAAAYDGHLGSGAVAGGAGHHPAFLKGLVNDAVLDGLDADRVLVDAQHTRALTRCWTHTTCELWEVVGLQQPVEGTPPVALVHQLVELGDAVGQGAAGGGLMAEGGAALHAACSLSVQQLPSGVRGDFSMHLLPVLHALLRRAVGHGFARILHEATALVSIHGWQHSGTGLIPGQLHALDGQALSCLALEELAVKLWRLGLVIGGNGLRWVGDGGLGGQPLQLLKRVAALALGTSRCQQRLLCGLSLCARLPLSQGTSVLQGEHHGEVVALAFPVHQQLAGHV